MSDHSGKNVCCACKMLHITNELLLKHILMKHPSLKTFSCMETHCLRSFSTYNSFQKHRRRTHYDLSVNTPNLAYNQKFQAIDNEDEFIDVDNPFNSSSPTNNIVHQEEPFLLSDNIENTDGHKTQNNYKILLLAKLHSYNDIPRSRIINIMDDFSLFLNREIDSIISDLEKYLPVSLNEECRNKIIERKDPFKNLGTEYLQLKLFKQLGTYIPPEQILLGEREEFRKKNEKMMLVKVKTSAEFIPISQVLKVFFELPNIYDRTIEYINMLNSFNDKVIINFIQSKFWKEKTKIFYNSQKIVFPLFLYFDDFENNNALGSHAGIAKCGAVYISIPCLPDDMRSKLENIFPFCLFNTLDRKVFKNENVFRHILRELDLLERKGIVININGKSIRIFFILALVLGDNLGLHSILGLTESFRGSYPCRFCLIHFNDLSKYFSEDELIALGLLRSEDKYAADVRNILSGNSHNIVEECIFHKLPNYHITKNICVDVMHDVWEGIVHYDLSKILDVFINQKKYFSLNQLNDRILAFKYQEWENKPVEINENHIKRMKLKMSSAETMTFVRNFTFLIGDLIPDSSDSHWELFLKLKKMIDTIMNSLCYCNSDKYLAVLISEYLSLLCNLFPNSVKPKHHHLLHYPRVMAEMGPLWPMSSMRFESKHREAKTVSKNSICRINICHTIAIKTQLKLNYRFLSNENSDSSIWSFGPSKKVILSTVPQYNNFKFLLSDAVKNDLNIQQLKWVSLYSKKIIPGYFLGKYNEENEISFLKIKHLLLADNGFFILAEEFKKTIFDPHFNCFQIPDKNEFSWILLSTNEVEELKTCSVYQNTFININIF